MTGVVGSILTRGGVWWPWDKVKHDGKVGGGGLDDKRVGA